MWYKSEKLRLVLNYCMAGLLNHNPGNYIVKENLIAVLCVVNQCGSGKFLVLF